MITIKNLDSNLIFSLLKPAPKPIVLYNAEINSQSNKLDKTKSLACLAYENRKQRGLISNEKSECPTVFFGDEWAF